MTTAVIDLVAPPPPSILSSSDLWLAIKDCEDQAVLDLWQQFGEMLLTEVQARTSALESKANSLLGWSAAAAVAGVALAKTNAVVAVVCVIAAALAALCCFLALRVSATAVPSQLDWFSHSESCEARRLQRFYLLAMRDWHENDSLVNRAKGAWLTIGQYCLAVAASGLFVQLLLAAIA